MLRMKHAEHGFHHAYTPQEEALMRQNGWRGEDEADPVEAERTPDLDAVRAEAIARGVAVDRRWGIPRLRAEIDKA